MKSVEFPHLHPTSGKVSRHLAKRYFRTNWNTAAQTAGIAYQEFIHAGLTLLKIDPFDCHLLLLGRAEGCLHHRGRSAAWGEKRELPTPQGLQQQGRELRQQNPECQILEQSKVKTQWKHSRHSPLRSSTAATSKCWANWRKTSRSSWSLPGIITALHTKNPLQIPYKRVILLMYFLKDMSLRPHRLLTWCVCPKCQNKLLFATDTNEIFQIFLCTNCCSHLSSFYAKTWGGFHSSTFSSSSHTASVSRLKTTIPEYLNSNREKNATF